MMPDRPPPPLEYAAPPVFYCGEDCTRTPYTRLTAIVAGTLGVAAIIVVPLLLPRAEPFLRHLLLGLAGVLLLIAGWNAWQWHRNLTRVVRITGDGIEVAGKFWPWARIRSVGAVSRGGLTLTFDLHGFALHGAGRALAALSAMSRDDYATLRADLDHHFRTRGLDVVTTDVRIPSS